MVIYKIVLIFINIKASKATRALRRVKIGFLTNHRGSLALPTPCFGFLSSTIVREHIADLLSQKRASILFPQTNHLFSESSRVLGFFLSDLTGHRKHYSKRKMTTFHQSGNPKLLKWVYAILYQI